MIRHAATIRTSIALLALAAVHATAAGEASFSGARALAHLETICALGPRPSGSPAMDRQRALLADHFR